MNTYPKIKRGALLDHLKGNKGKFKVGDFVKVSDNCDNDQFHPLKLKT